MAFHPFASRYRWIAWLAAALLLLISLVLPIQLLRTHLGPTTVVLFLAFLLILGLLVLLVYRLWALHRLDYWVDRDAVRIHWAGNRIDVPLPDIEEVEIQTNWSGSGLPLVGLARGLGATPATGISAGLLFHPITAREPGAENILHNLSHLS